MLYTFCSVFLPFIFGGGGVRATPERSLADMPVISISADALQRERRRRAGGKGKKKKVCCETLEIHSVLKKPETTASFSFFL